MAEPRLLKQWHMWMLVGLILMLAVNSCSRSHSYVDITIVNGVQETIDVQHLSNTSGEELHRHYEGLKVGDIDDSETVTHGSIRWHYRRLDVDSLKDWHMFVGRVSASKEILFIGRYSGEELESMGGEVTVVDQRISGGS